MGISEFGYLVATLVVGILATVGWAVMSLTPADFTVARRCFWATSLLFAGIGIVWGITTPESVWIRFPIVCLVAGISIGGLSEALRWVKTRQAASEQLAPVRIDGAATTRLSSSQESDDSLISRTRKLAADLRTFDARRSQMMLDLIGRLPPIRANTSEEQRTKDWDEKNQALNKFQADTVIEFRNRYRPDALRVRDELLFRIGMQGKAPPAMPAGAERILERNSLAGVSPITELADHLEALTDLLAH